ncbi:Exodeoxyribonuclease 7 large subunit [uncultured Clostridium sp.]|uniref:Exodeoxyribonuclease 7 large subunit n=1 Tax=Muricoprocola aceti TaxID=2981772 RepID=A0ABT2SQ56_9FIRM|nr:exodeoxyribonuclease VII large subunit [Muricoprocola aceti]MCI7226432.1 exodeoxyribonuclease VII large subunit [Lachnospiraceae bacterium]MCQ4773990.1 exodeoxyribonuclease VII large subunit [Lacrimispora saccharolytica]SCH88756.1 Exodeoxyribonuclease 7 large subunit [uncultured Clostridium sp.]MCU6726395.1 exodeoxyribonuclease VII large subunit [Muricoprocola aceti]MDD7436495.1 exodeoxyribonuclease VII large subunit [Lachnospiraceae bacterium]
MKNVYSIRQVNLYISNMFRQDFMLNRIYVKGEVSNCKYHTSGHIYFSLKDDSGSLACVMFAGNRSGLKFQMQNGQSVIVLGSISVYERDGKYQLYAREIIQDGMGLLYEKFQALKQELEEMGMFAPEYKQPIPAFSRRVGIVTAPTGAAIRDIMNISYRRNPYVQLILYPALVQGEEAADSIVRGIELLDQSHVDVIIVGRGGGSMEDLWAFNEEKVARAIFQCETPVISAVGHETDFTIADYVADLRAPTPSAAAELAVADMAAIQGQLRDMQQRLQNRMSERLSDRKKELEHLQEKLKYVSPQHQIQEKYQRLTDIEEELQMLMQQTMKERRHQLMIYVERMKGLSPLEKLSQGYSYTADARGKKITATEQVQPGDLLQIYVSDGQILAEVKEKKKTEDWSV